MPLAVLPVSVYATTYFTTEQAQQAMFPGETLKPAFVTLTDSQVQQVEKTTDVNVRHKDVKAWKASGGGWFILDEVVGKHEFITYAVALDAAGAVRQIEVMDYRESYGHEIRNPDWRKQFVGKTSADHLELTRDIRNISGATLSCRHITDGVKRVLATYAVALR